MGLKDELEKHGYHFDGEIISRDNDTFTVVWDNGEEIVYHDYGDRMTADVVKLNGAKTKAMIPLVYALPIFTLGFCVARVYYFYVGYD